MRRNRLLALLVLSLLPAIAGAVPYQAGPYVVDVEVRNTALKLIPDAHVRASVSGKEIRVTGSAEGYRSVVEKIAIAGQQQIYKVDLVLPDPAKVLHVVDRDGKPMAAAYFQPGQFGFDPREFGITVFVPTKQWPKPSPKGVNVIETSWGMPLARWTTYEAEDDYYRVRLAVSRRACDFTGPDFVVVFDTRKDMGEPMRGPEVAQRVRQLADFVARAPLAAEPGMQQAAAEYLCATCDRDELGAQPDKPAMLTAWLEQARRFDALHRPEALASR